jgi:hypothetical protein
MATSDDYLALVTPEHIGKPRFVASLAVLVQPVAETVTTALRLPEAFDLDEANGPQLDIIGLWVGAPRNVSVPLSGVYFTFDDDNLGFDAGYFKGQFDPVEGLGRLDDDNYRILLRAKIRANHWDGTLDVARSVMADLIPNNLVYVQDNQDMSMTVGVVGPALDAILKSLMTGGHLALKPEGVSIDTYLVPSPSEPGAVEPEARFFGFDAEGDVIVGFDAGAWGVQA